VWSGSFGAGRDVRTHSIETFAPLANARGVNFFSLQKGTESDQPSPPVMSLIDYSSELTDFAETAALVHNLDLIISVDTSVAHLAGALARPVWVLIPFQCDFRWLQDRTDSPWYPTMRLFREPVAGDFVTPVSQMLKALQEFPSARRRV
jgi:ADP-heptose:LPS heptosyltransferase